MNDYIIKIIKQLLFIGLTGAILYWVFRNISFIDLADELKTANFLYVIVGAVASLMAHSIRAVRWRMLMTPIGYKPPLLRVWAAVQIGLLANLALPRLGEVSRCIILNKSDNVPMDKLLGTVVTERIIDVISLLIIICLAMLLEFNRIMGFITQKLGLSFQFLSFNNIYILIAIILSCIVVMVYYDRIVYIICNNSYIKSVYNKLQGFRAGLTSILMMKNRAKFIILTLLIWFFFGLGVSLMLKALSSTNHLNSMAALFVLAVGTIGMAAPVQGGIGTFHWTVSQGLIFYGIDIQDGLAYATLSHGADTLMNIIVGTLSLLGITFFTKKVLS